MADGSDMVERKHSGACRNWRKVPLLNVFVHDVTIDPAEIDRIIAKINDSGATVLLVGLGGGRQEKFIVRYRDRMPNIRLFLPLGGTIDYAAGTFKRPPAWITEWGFE